MSCRAPNRLVPARLAVALAALWGLGATAQPEIREFNVTVPDVVNQFNTLRTDGEWLGAYPNPDQSTSGDLSKNHYQGVTRQSPPPCRTRR